MTDQSLFDQLLHGAPGLHEFLVDVWLRVFAARFNRTTGRMKIWKRPVDEVEIEVVEPQVRQALPACGGDAGRGVLIIPDFGIDPQLGTEDTARHNFSQRLADEMFVSINRSAVKMPIARSGGADYGN